MKGFAAYHQDVGRTNVEGSQINEQVERVLLLVSDSGPGDDDAIIEALSLALDQLAVAVHFIRYTLDSREHPEAPPRQYQEMRRMIEGDSLNSACTTSQPP